ncbi:carboxylesterase [Evansella vedderi]|uniref:Carboxylesterase n=1 Tax=Evansella vedderi TaxID=38282 RepID=A0ABT9ZTT7_9BACI|nr:carboxylesterase [Evansella vedderi]MDQ0254614.1 carboxylesterase [Evansella vedderi]
MMKVTQPRPFTFEAGKRAVLLLHGFTGNSADVRMLARFLEKKGYTSHAPQYKGHAVPPEELVKYGPDDWWEDVQAGYNHLKELGYDEIAVGGLSLGGVFSLKVGYTLPVKGIIPMCAPVNIKGEEEMHQGVLDYARKYKRHEKKPEEQIEQEMKEFEGTPLPTIRQLQKFNKDVRANIDMIYAPTLVVQARHDEMIDTNSANIIYEEIQSDLKELNWYEESGHVITLDKERDQLHEDVYAFLEKLDWTV